MPESQAGDSRDEMRVFLIALDLSEQDGEAPERLVDVLESYPDHVRLWPSAWVVKAPGTAADVLEAVDEHLSRPDRVFVAAIAGDAGWRNVECDFTWLRENLEGMRLPS